MQDLSSQPGIEPEPPAVEVWNPNHWTTRGFPAINFSSHKFFFLILAYSFIYWANNEWPPYTRHCAKATLLAFFAERNLWTLRAKCTFSIEWNKGSAHTERRRTQGKVCLPLETLTPRALTDSLTLRSGVFRVRGPSYDWKRRLQILSTDSGFIAGL